MPGVLIKDMPKELHELLRKRAERNHRSLNKEALSMLEQMLLSERPRPSAEYFDRVRVRGKVPLTAALLRRAKTLGRP